MSATAKLIHATHTLRIEEDSFNLPTGKTVVRTIVRHPGAAVILPISEKSVRLVKQYRYAVGETLYEAPAGTLELDEEPFECAQRELAEETKLQAARWELLATIFPTPGFCDEKQHLYAAFDISQSHGQLDEDEIIEYVDVSFAELQNLVVSGSIKDAKTLSIICLAQARGLLPTQS